MMIDFEVSYKIAYLSHPQGNYNVIQTILKTIGKSGVKVFGYAKSELGEAIIFADENHIPWERRIPLIINDQGGKMEGVADEEKEYYLLVKKVFSILAPFYDFGTIPISGLRDKTVDFIDMKKSFTDAFSIVIYGRQFTANS